jgi:hypothetical protein
MLALLACAALGCGRSADLFPEDGPSDGALAWPPPTDPEPAQPDDALPLEPAEPSPERTPAGPRLAAPSELSPEAPPKPLPEPPARDAGLEIGFDAGVEAAPGGRGAPRPERPPRPPRL